MTAPTEQTAAPSRQQAAAKVAEIFDMIAGIPAEEVTPDRRLADDLAIDSLTMIEIAVTIQDELNVSVADDKLKELRTIGDIIDLVTAAR